MRDWWGCLYWMLVLWLSFWNWVTDPKQVWRPVVLTRITACLFHDGDWNILHLWHSQASSIFKKRHFKLNLGFVHAQVCIPVLHSHNNQFFDWEIAQDYSGSCDLLFSHMAALVLGNWPFRHQHYHMVQPESSALRKLKAASPQSWQQEKRDGK